METVDVLNEIKRKIAEALNDAKAFHPQYKEIVDVIGIDATIKLHAEFNGRRILCYKYLYDIDYIVKLASENKDTKFIERLVRETGYSYDWIKKKVRGYNKSLNII